MSSCKNLKIKSNNNLYIGKINILVENKFISCV
jgi:hypothetical protein